MRGFARSIDLATLSPDEVSPARRCRVGYKVLALAYFPPDGVSSALKGLTAEFGMGSGVALSLEARGLYIQP